MATPVGRRTCALGFKNETTEFRICLPAGQLIRCLASTCLLHFRLRPMTDPSAGNPEPTAESLEVIRKFAETYAQRTGTYFCSDPGVTAVVLKGLARHKDELGGALCPCRHYEDKEAEVSQAFWNCPCVPMRERKECHCMLFLTEDNPFRGDAQTISTEEIHASAG
jgi:ferredoxin-thioredoxin reductase catalytic chain